MMIITTTTTLVVMIPMMIFTTMGLETRRRKRRITTTASHNKNHQVHLSQSHRQFHKDFMVTQLNQAVVQTTVEYTPEVVSMLLLVILNLMHQHQEFQTTGLGLSTL